MDKDAHYYAVIGFSRALGYDKETAQKIAHASQFVDDAKINYMTAENIPKHLKHDKIKDEPGFLNMATCHAYFKIKTYNWSSMINNTTAFHFVPGCDGKCFERKMRCRQKNPVIAEIMDKAILEPDPIKFGMVLHPFADTFSHQGFSGILSQVNDIRKCRADSFVSDEKIRTKLIKWVSSFSYFEDMKNRFIPVYGHGQADVYPDQPYLKWEYEYYYRHLLSTATESSVVENKDRFTQGFEMIVEKLKEFLDKHQEFRDDQFSPIEDLKPLFDTLLKEGGLKKRIANWQKLFVEKGLFRESDEAYTYKEDRWLKQAFSDYDKKKFNSRELYGVRVKNNFSECDWYTYYNAVHWYKPEFFKACRKNGLPIPNEYE